MGRFVWRSLASALLFVCLQCQAVLIAGGPGTVIVKNCNSGTLPSSYDSLNDVYSESGPFGSALCPAFLGPSSGTFVDGFVGSWNLSANVDNGGITHGGAFSWIASNPGLGIATPRVILAGSVL